MRPKYKKVLELAIPSDFSQCAMNSAMDLIWTEIAPKGYHLGKDFYSLDIGVEGDLLKAINVCQAWGVNLSLNREFASDEWLLSCMHPTDDGFESVYVWCPGA